MIKKHWKGLLVSILIPLIFGVIGSLLGGAFNQYEDLNRPWFAPPGIVFPIAWTIIYILMGISSYMIYQTKSKEKDIALKIYFTQLIINALWTLIFFRLQLQLFAFIWLIILLATVIIMVYKFYKIEKIAGYLQIPYILWLIFAGILNIAIYILNN